MKFNLTRLAILTAICLLSVSIGMAGVTCPAPGGVPMAPTYVTQNIAGNGAANGFVCDLGNLQFSNFTYVNSPNTVTASGVTVTPITSPGNEGLDFNGGWSAAPGTTSDITIKFTVTALSGVIDDLGIDIAGANVQGAGSSISYIEQFCNVGGTCSIFTDTPVGPLSTDLSLAASGLGSSVTQLNIVKDLRITAGSGNNSSAEISDFDNHYSNHAVPEPRTVSVLLSLALFAGVIYMKKRSQAVRS